MYTLHVYSFSKIKQKKQKQKEFRPAYIFIYQLLIEMSKYLACIVQIWFCSNVKNEYSFIVICVFLNCLFRYANLVGVQEDIFTTHMEHI